LQVTFASTSHKKYLDQLSDHDSFVDSPSHGLEYNLIGTLVLQVSNIKCYNKSGTQQEYNQCFKGDKATQSELGTPGCLGGA